MSGKDAYNIARYFNVVQYCPLFIVHLKNTLLQSSVCILHLYKVSMHTEKLWKD